MSSLGLVMATVFTFFSGKFLLESVQNPRCFAFFAFFAFFPLNPLPLHQSPSKKKTFFSAKLKQNGKSTPYRVSE
jgi:hypothetical protein